MLAMAVLPGCAAPTTPEVIKETVEVPVEVTKIVEVPAEAGPVTLEVLSPRVDFEKAAPLTMVPRLADLSGKKIGIINNTKAGADAFQPYLEEVLKEAVPTIELKIWSISYNAYEGKEEDLKEVAEASDGVIVLIGD